MERKEEARASCLGQEDNNQVTMEGIKQPEQIRSSSKKPMQGRVEPEMCQGSAAYPRSPIYKQGTDAALSPACLPFTKSRSRRGPRGGLGLLRLGLISCEEGFEKP